MHQEKTMGQSKVLKQRRQWLMSQNPHCAYCGRKLSSRMATVDHVIPRALGGTNRLDNLRLSCRECNNIKGDSEWRQEMRERSLSSQARFKQAQREVAAFNNRFPVGTPVILEKDSGPVETSVVAPAEIMGGHSAVAWFSGVRGCYSVSEGRVRIHDQRQREAERN